MCFKVVIVVFSIIESFSSLNIDNENGKSSLVFVFDTTGSMHNDLRQLREGAEMILNTALKESNIIEDFVFVPFHDPAVGPVTVTKDKQVFKSALNIVRVYGGGDCPEKSLGGILLGLSVSRARSYVYVFTDATASDHRLVGKVLDAVQRKQSQVVFVLTGHCNDLHRPSYKVYQQIAAVSSGQVFNLNKTSVHKVLDFVRSSITGRTVNLGSVVNPAGYNYSQGIPIDSTLGELTVSVSGAKPSIRVVNPSGEELTGPPKLITTLDLSEIMVVKVLQPEAGNWTIWTGSEDDHSVKVVGLSNLTFNHGFSVEKPRSMAETSYRPLQGTYNHLMISLTQIDRPVNINYAEIVTLNGTTLFEIPLREVNEQRKIYLADAFVPPDDFFYIAINGHDEFNQELRRIGVTAVQAKPPDVPFLTVQRKVEGRSHERIILRCNIESLVPITAMWTKDTVKIQDQISSLQSTIIEYVIEDLNEGDVGLYQCVAKNVAGVAKALTEVTLLVDPPQVTISPENKTLKLGETLFITCTVLSEVLLKRYQLSFNGTKSQYVTNINMEPNMDGIYIFNKTIEKVSEKESGLYSCIASNRGGQTIKSTYITVQSQPTAQILGPHTIIRPIHSDIQLVCSVENADRVVWVASNSTTVKENSVNGSLNDVFIAGNVTEDGIWTCIALRDSLRASDSVEIEILIKPQVTIEGVKNITVLNGTSFEITCSIIAKPPPRILWHRETERFLNNNSRACGALRIEHCTVLMTITAEITNTSPNVYKSVLTLDSTKEAVNSTYFCFGENSVGINQDSINVNVRRKMLLLEGFTDKSVQLYSKIKLHCRVDSYPPAQIHWYHNNTSLNTNTNIQLSENNSTLIINRVDFENFGVYTCEADNGFEKLKLEGRIEVHGLEIPLLSKEPIKQITQKGKSTIITCRVIKGSPEPTITWQYSTNASEYTILPQDVILSENKLELIISKVKVEHSGIYRCIAENAIGRDVYEVSFVVQYPPKLSKKSKEEEEPREIKAGGRVTFSCKAAGIPPPIVIWTKDNHPVHYSKNVYLSGEDLVLEKVTEYDTGIFTCNATSVLGSSQRNFTLIVYVPPTIIQPGIEPELEVLEGQLVELPCVTEGVPKPVVKWLHNGQVIEDERKYIDHFGLRFVANLTDFGEYTCIAKNFYGNASFTFSIYIWVPPYIEPPLETSRDVLFGSNVSLNCDAVGFPIPTVFWEFRDNLLIENTTDLSFNEYGNVFVKNASYKHEGLYVCIAENIAGIAKKATYLYVNEPPVIFQDNNTAPYIATEKDTNNTAPYIATEKDKALVITCRATGKPRPFIVWSKDNVFLDKDSRYDLDIDGTLTIKSPSEDLSGLYTCIAKNVVGQVNRTIAVDIYSLPSRMQSEESQITITVLEGTNSTIQCPIRASQNDIVKWYKDAKLITQGNLQILNISRHNTSTYACVVTNIAGSAYTSVHINVEWPPTFIEPFENGLNIMKEESANLINDIQNVEVVRGNDWYFDCKVDANPGAKTKWLFNSKPILGEDKDRLKLINIQQYHTGTYKCIVSNNHGTEVRQFSLDVLVPPFISEFDRLDVQLKEGSNATLECNARGSPKPDIEWTYNSNTTWHQNYTTLTNVTPQSAGLYKCKARNKAGQTHIVYLVSVVVPARVRDVLVTETETHTVVGSRVKLSCIATGAPTPKIQWIRNGNTVSENKFDISYADLVFNDLKTADAGVYTCVVSNEGGMDERQIRLDVLEPPKIFHNLFETSPINNRTLEVISGQTFYLHCHPYGNPLPQIYWFFNGSPLKLFDDSMVSKEFGEILLSNSATFEQSGNYTCVARNDIGNASVSYLVDVLVPPPTPKESFKPVKTRVGKPLYLTCPVEGSPLPNVMWVKHPYTEIGETPRVELINDNVTLIINKTEIQDSGKYSCIMTNKVGSTEVIFDVTIEKPPSIAGNLGENVVENHVVPLRRSIVLKCQADGNPTPKISWLKDTQQLSGSLSNIQRVLGNSILAIWSANVRDAGQYICVVENNAGTAHRRFNIAVKVPGKWRAWSQWSYCNVTCGLGYQMKSRICHYLDDYNNTYDKTTKSDKIILDDSACKGPATDRRKCHMPPCEDETQMRWSSWTKWSQCSATCGIGTQARTRRCKTRVKCFGDNVQMRRCPDLPNCLKNTGSSENEVYNSGENIDAETSAYIPDTVFDAQPDISYSKYSPDVEELNVNHESKYSMIYFDVNVTDNLDQSERGPCDPGYRFNSIVGSCDDIDECILDKNKCHSTQECVNTAGAYKCGCTKGFASLGAGQRCLDINECQQDIDGCEYACVNVAGGYVCACPGHMRLHTDKHRCITPSSYHKPHSYEDENEEYLSTAIDFPTRYTKRN